MSVVVFDPTAFKAKAQYAEFATVSDATLVDYFSVACGFCNNTDGSIITDVDYRSNVLQLLTAHIAKLMTTDSVGRVSSAGEGSVNVSLAYATPSGARAWFDQTRYGAMAYQLMSAYRRALYVPPQASATYFVPRG